MNVLKNLNYLTFGMVIFLSLSAFPLMAQSKKNKKEQISYWKEKVWYGGGFNLGFSSNYYDGYQSNVFGIGVSPMAGHKFNHWLSAGPRFSIDFTTAKFSDAFDTYSYNSLDFGVGLFSRMKFLNNWFVHMEYSWLNETIAYLYPGYIEKERQWRDILLFGIGYTSGGDVAYEIYVNYDFFEDPDSYRVPIVYRAGNSFKF